MLRLVSARERLASAGARLAGIRAIDWRGRAVSRLGDILPGVMAGLTARELRAILRGDAPAARPNPRYVAHDRSFLLHIRPKHYRRASTRFTHTFRLGWLAAFLFIVETATGLLLMVYYVPSPDQAYGSMRRIIGSVPFGQLVRDLHRLGAEAMVAVVVLHMARVYFTGSYKGRRRFTWVTGVILLLVTLLFSFSGYLLPWDQLAYWAVTIGTSIVRAAPVIGEEANLMLRGASEIGADGLLRFYSLHVLLLPLVAILGLSVHYYKVAREHSISLPASVEEGALSAEERKRATEKIDLLPDLLIHEAMLTAVVLLLLVVAVSTFYHAPLEAPADPRATPPNAVAPWYFLWLQGLLKLGRPALMGVALPCALLAIVLALPWIDRNPHRLAIRRKVAVLNGTFIAVALALLTVMGTPSYGIEAAPAELILSRYVPATEPGPIRAVAWDKLRTGPGGARKTYFVSYPPEWETDPRYADRSVYEFVSEFAVGEQDELTKLLAHLKADVESAPELISPLQKDAPLAQVTVESYQPHLKWVTVRLTWDELVTDPATGEARLERRATKEAGFAVHRDSGYHD